jgi:hypothetical protein
MDLMLSSMTELRGAIVQTVLHVASAFDCAPCRIHHLEFCAIVLMPVPILRPHPKCALCLAGMDGSPQERVDIRGGSTSRAFECWQAPTQVGRDC